MKTAHLKYHVVACLPLALAGCLSEPADPSVPQIPLTPGATISQAGGATVGAQVDPAEPSPLVERMRLRDRQQATDPYPPADELRGASELEGRDGVRLDQPAPPPPPPPPPADDADTGSGGDASSGTVRPDQPLYPVAGMVGQVNGLPIYADEVLEPIGEQLRALAQQHDAAEFRRQASGLIEGRVRQMVIDALIYAEAERDLSDAERQGLREMVRRREAELIRERGQGSRAVAERALAEREGQSLAQALRAYRERSVVQRYMRKTIAPKITVTRRELERAYTADSERYTTGDSRTVRVIVTGEDEAGAVGSALDSGRAFAEVASGEMNRFRASTGGLWGEVEGQPQFAVEAVNEAVTRLGEGEWAGPIEAGGEGGGNGEGGEGEVWFVAVEDVERGETVPLKEAQRELDRKLREQQFRELTQQYRRDVTGRGSYTDIDEMVEAVLEVAASRYEAEAV